MYDYLYPLNCQAIKICSHVQWTYSRLKHSAVLDVELWLNMLATCSLTLGVCLRMTADHTS